MKAKNKGKNNLVILILVIVAFGMLGIGNFSSLSRTPAASAPSSSGSAQQPNRSSSRDLALSCTSDALTQFHIHPRFAVIINGAKQTIPAGIGIAPDCLRVIHTHDDTGTIHIESPAQADFVLGDFFAVWGKIFTRDQVLDYKADASHEILMTVDGSASNDYENLVLKDGQNIIIEYKSSRQQ